MAQVQREVLGTIELCKNELRVHLGAQFDDYWRQLKDFFVFKLSKKDLDAMVNNLCGPKLHLHNSLVRAIMRDAVAKAVHHPKNVAAAAAQTALAFKRIKPTSEAAAAAAAAAAANSSKNGVNGVGTSATPPLKPKRRRPDSKRNPSANASSVVSSAASTTPANSDKISRPEKQGRRDRPQKDGGDKGGKPSSSRPSSSAASALRKRETAAVATAAAASAAAAPDGPRNRKKVSSSASSANTSKKAKEDPELERMHTAAKKADVRSRFLLPLLRDHVISSISDEVDQSLRLQETFFREFTLIDGCDLNDSSAPLPHQLQIRRMMKRQVLECGIQDISKDAAKFVSDALDIYLQKLIQRMISTRGILRERKSSIVNADLGLEREHIPHASAFACKWVMFCASASEPLHFDSVVMAKEFARDRDIFVTEFVRNPQSLAQLQWAMWNSDVVLPSDMIMVFRQVMNSLEWSSRDCEQQFHFFGCAPHV